MAHHEQLSRFQNRRFHDREVHATLTDGSMLIWDLGNGVNGVMQNRFECRVNLTVSQ